MGRFTGLGAEGTSPSKDQEGQPIAPGMTYAALQREKGQRVKIVWVLEQMLLAQR
jgi:hypothetical protein